MKSNASSTEVPLPFVIRTPATEVVTPFVMAMNGPPMAPTDPETVRVGVLEKGVAKVIVYTPVLVRDDVNPEPTTGVGQGDPAAHHVLGLRRIPTSDPDFHGQTVGDIMERSVGYVGRIRTRDSVSAAGPSF